MPVDPSVERLSVTLVDESRNELLTRSVVRSGPSEEKLDGRELENPFSRRVLISLDDRYWKVLLPVVPGVAALPPIDDFG